MGIWIFLTEIQSDLQESQDYKRIFRDVFGDFPSFAWSIGYEYCLLYLHPFVFCWKNSRLGDSFTKAGVVFDSQEFDLDIAENFFKTKFGSEDDPDARDAEWIAHLPYDEEGCWWDVIPEFLEMARARWEAGKEVYFSEREERDRQKLRKADKHLASLLAESAVEPPSQEVASCPSCGGELMYLKKHGRFMECLNCSEDLVVFQEPEGNGFDVENAYMLEPSWQAPQKQER